MNYIRSLFLSCLVFSRVIEKGKVALDQPGKGVSLWTRKHNCPFYLGLEARAGRGNFLPKCLLLAKGGMKCHTNYLGSGQCKESWMQLCEAAARAPITEWGWGGFLCCCTQLSRCTHRPQHTRGPEVWLQHREALSLHWGKTKKLGPQSAFAFKAQSHFGAIQDQSRWRSWNCVSAADIWTVMELGVMPGCTKSCALLRCCFGGGRKKKGIQRIKNV